MDRNELTMAVAGALVAAVMLGWLIGAIAARLGGRGAAALAAARARAQAAETRADAAEADCARRLAEVEADLARARAEAEGLRAALNPRPSSDPGSA